MREMCEVHITSDITKIVSSRLDFIMKISLHADHIIIWQRR